MMVAVMINPAQDGTMVTEPPTVSFGDHVRIVSNPETQRKGYAGRAGQRWGFTTPSVTNVDVVGGTEPDRAFNVHFEEDDIVDAWFVPDLVELIDLAPGTDVRIGDTHLVRDAQGEWQRVEDQDD
jgi:hypothetical protein